MKRTLKRLIACVAGTALAAMVSGAIYLMIVRGDALMIDLQNLSGLVFCF